MGFRAELCYELSRRRLQGPSSRTASAQAYTSWRTASLASSWSAFSDEYVAGKDVLDFGCGDGELSLYLAQHKRPRRLLGIDVNPAAIERAHNGQAVSAVPSTVDLEFAVGSPEAMPVPEQSFDTLVAFDCLEHVMAPAQILRDWYRVLRPGGRCLVEWFPYKGPWGPHMESLVPIPWAHVLFGERAMLRAAERLYDHPHFEPRHWDLDEHGRKKPNKWRAWSSFDDQAYINKLDLAGFEKLVAASGLRIDRLDKRSFGGSRLRQGIGRTLMNLPLVGEYFVSYVLVELVRP
jgi:ubiquinone/menaquinone biosynthesis C-methylase UbiE